MVGALETSAPPENCTNKANSILKGVQLSQLHQQNNIGVSTWLVHFLL